MRGVGTESSKDTTKFFKEKKGVGSIISLHNIINPTQRYQTGKLFLHTIQHLTLNLGFVAESMVSGVYIDLNLIKEKVKIDKQVSFI